MLLLPLCGLFNYLPDGEKERKKKQSNMPCILLDVGLKRRACECVLIRIHTRAVRYDEI